MSVELSCPVCDAEIPLERETRSGDLVVCSYCGVTFKLLKRREQWILEEEFEE